MIDEQAGGISKTRENNMRGSKFQKRGGGVYKCCCCNRMTRKTGQQSDSPTCPECWELSGIDNAFSDNGPEEARASYDREIKWLVAKALKQGSSADAMRKSFPFLTDADMRG
jgi:hypothetical protein